MAKLPSRECDLSFSRPIKSWDEAIPLGNGILGSLIWGESDSLRMSIDRGDLWDSTLSDAIKDPKFCYSEMVRLAKAGKNDEIREIFDSPYYNVTPTKLPAGKIIFDFGKEKSVTSYLRLDKAEAELTIGDECKLFSFIHSDMRVGFIRIEGDNFKFKVERPQYGVIGENTEYHYNQNERSISNSLSKLSYPAPKTIEENGILGFVQEISDGSAYVMLAKAMKKGKYTEIAYTVALSADGSDWLDCAKALVEAAIEKGYEGCFADHCKWWGRFWGESAIDLPDKFFEKNWYLTNYLLASCSRKGYPPMPLQGVWTADNDELPPWKGDYHHDLNTQMSYYSYLKANHLEQGESFIDFLNSSKKAAGDFAKSFYNTDGICLPSVMTLHGAPLGGWAMYSLSPTNQLWLCQTFERHYTYTGDKEFLKNTAYPYMKESAEMILGLMEKNERGEYLLPISSSPEIHDDTIEAFLTPNSNYDLSLMRYLFGKLISFSDELNNGEKQKWQEAYDNLPALSISDNGVLMLSPDEKLNESHRHHAHAMAIHPLRLLDPYNEADREVIDATVVDMERLGTGWWVGYSFTWFAEFFAIQKNGEGAAYQLRLFWENFCSQNGFHLNGDYKKRGLSQFHYRPFTLEGNLCAADVLQEMLLQSENGKNYLFPAIPEEWKEHKVSFEDFRAEKGLLISAKAENGRVVAVSLKPAWNGEYIFVGEFADGTAEKTFELKKGELYNFEFAKN